MGIIQLSNNSFSVNEAAGLAKVTLIRTGNTTNQTKLEYTVLPGTAQDFLDYTGNLYGLVTFDIGQSIKIITVPILNDTVAELEETFSIVTGELVNNYVAPGEQPDQLGSPRTAIITISDDEIPSGESLEFSLNNFTVQENQEEVAITVTKTPTDVEATVNFNTEDYYAKSLTTKPEYQDYISLSQTLTFAPQETIKTITIKIINDNLPEINETLKLFLSNPVNTNLGLKNNATVTINNDDSPPVVFTKEVLTTNLNQPTAFAMGNEGKIYIAESSGKIKIFDQNSNTLLPTPFLDISDRVNNASQRGILSFTIDPDFPAKPYLYLGYTYESLEDVGADGPDSEKPRKNRLVRITADATTNYTTAIPNSEVLLMEVPHSDNAHASAGIAFGKDGSLFWSHGDGSRLASVFSDPGKFQDLNYPFGKLFRINPANGKGYADNPFYDGNPDTYRSKVYSYGLRNPFRIAIHPTTGEPYIGDVGWDQWEEVNTGRGKNFGWPLYEGGLGESMKTQAYATNPELLDLYAEYGQVTAPLYAFHHKDGFSSIIMGDFYQSDVYPSIFKDSLFLSDLRSKTLYALNFDTTGQKVENALVFGNSFDVVATQISVGADGFLYGIDYDPRTETASSLVRWVIDQPLPKITITDVSVTEGNTSTTNANFLVTLDKQFHYNLIVNYATEEQRSSNTSELFAISNDYQSISGKITFSPGTTLTTIQVPVIGDTLFERNETFLLRLKNPINGTLTRTTAQGLIVNDDIRPQITISDPTVIEGNIGTIAKFLVTLNSPSGRLATVNYTTTAQTALSNGDYQASFGLITFTPGITVSTVEIPVMGDSQIEPTETFLLNLINPVNALITDSTGIATIVDDDTPPKITIQDTSILEGNSGTTNAALRVNLDSVYGAPIILNYSTTPQTASSGSDYQVIFGQVTFFPGTTVQTIQIPVIGDSLFENNESFLVRLRFANSLQGSFARSAAIATILNDDAPPKITLSDTSVIERNSSTTADFLVTLDSPSGLPVTVNYSTSNQTAFSGSDYLLTSGTITFAPGITVSTIQVPIVGDTLWEKNETFLLRLRNPVNGAFNRSAALGIILNDDSLGSALPGSSAQSRSQFVMSSLIPSDVLGNTFNRIERFK